MRSYLVLEAIYRNNVHRDDVVGKRLEPGYPDAAVWKHPPEKARTKSEAKNVAQIKNKQLFKHLIWGFLFCMQVHFKVSSTQKPEKQNDAQNRSSTFMWPA